MIIGATVQKEFRSEDSADHVSHLVKIYNLLKWKRVLNVDELVSSSTQTEDSHLHIYLKPVGLHTAPQSGSESFSVIYCVLVALKVCYDASVFTT